MVWISCKHRLFKEKLDCEFFRKVFLGNNKYRFLLKIKKLIKNNIKLTIVDLMLSIHYNMFIIVNTMEVGI